jgi:rSAM/selenodomain-associated transferase 1
MPRTFWKKTTSVFFVPNPNMPSPSPSRIIELCKYPSPGLVKTRLVPILGTDGAADLQRRMALFVFSEVKKAADLTLASVEICYDGADRAAFREMFGSAPDLHRQDMGDLGKRINSAFTRAFKLGACRALLTGSDCPCVTAAVLCEALDSLCTHDAVIGPAADGGYYLIGLTKPMPFLFENMPWSTDAVFEETVLRFQKNAVSFHILEKGWDVDLPEDIHLFEEVEEVARKPR